MHDTIGCYLDIDKGHVKFSKNGKLSVDLLVREDVHYPVFWLFLIPLPSSSVFSPSPFL